MKVTALCLLVLSSAAFAQSPHSMPMSSAPAPDEKLGTVSFAVSCSSSVQASFNRGVALLHDFWYEEAGPQFERIAKADPNCAMAHWGIAMSKFHQIWDRPDEATMKAGWEEMQKAQSPAAKTPRERAYIAALAAFYKPGKQDFMARVTAYSDAMGAIYKQYPDDVDAGAFYALSLLASGPPDDTSLTQNRKAMAVLTPLFAKYPDNPGLVHYIIHSCDNPAMAADGLAAADRYGIIAASGPARRPHVGTHLRPPGHVAAGHRLSARIDQSLRSSRGPRRERHHGRAALLRLPDVRLPAERSGRQRQRGRREDAFRIGTDQVHAGCASTWPTWFLITRANSRSCTRSKCEIGKPPRR